MQPLSSYSWKRRTDTHTVSFTVFLVRLYTPQGIIIRSIIYIYTGTGLCFYSALLHSQLYYNVFYLCTAGIVLFFLFVLLQCFTAFTIILQRLLSVHCRYSAVLSVKYSATHSWVLDRTKDWNGVENHCYCSDTQEGACR